MPSTGLIVGKFYPPHRGHRFLVETARAQVDRLVVLICEAAGQKIPGALRASWLREMCPGVEVRVIPDDLPADDSRAWAENCRRILGYAPDVVFTSEDYGDAFAQFLGCRHVLVDRERGKIPCSGTAVRDNPLAMWDCLDSCVRAHYVKRVCVVGAESTGTTTMARALAEHYGTVWVPEYGRDYWVEKMERCGAGWPSDWTTKEFIHIAAEQNRREDRLARFANRVLFCDTDSFATGLWHERYMGFVAPEVEAKAAGRRYDLYLLTDADIPFEQDGCRDGEHIRLAMHHRFAAELAARNKPHILLSGPHDRRLATAIHHVDALIRG